MVVRVLKADIFKDNIALCVSQFHSIRFVKDLNVRVHNLQKTLNARKPSLKLLRKLYNPADGGDEGGHIQHVSHQIPGLHQALYHKYPPSHQHQKVHQSVEKFYRGVERRHIAVCKLFYVEESAVVFLKFPGLYVLVGEGFHHLVSQKTVLNAGVQLPDLVPLLSESRPHAEVQKHAHHQHQGHAQENNQGQGKADARQHSKGNHGLDTCDEELLRTVMGKLRHVEKVVGDAAHDLAHLGIVIISVGEPLQMTVGVPAHVCLNPGSHHMPHVGHVIAGQTVHNAQAEVQKSQSSHGLNGEGRQIPDPFVCDIPHNQRQHKLTHCGHGRAEQIQHQSAPVLLKIRDKPPQKFFCTVLLCFCLNLRLLLSLILSSCFRHCQIPPRADFLFVCAAITGSCLCILSICLLYPDISPAASHK